ncbi:hypothetical protein HK103_001448 [Boothiomyces macroporosus]|uniref:Uncharacterized protein n=1 Tax=Boothiomyces macroporosus TaxID=261099 RepID=A0AAD5Y9T5_9FUNG|nr:hypothetical protein HK103_001448 [Boothiomyces macroporosus]
MFKTLNFAVKLLRKTNVGNYVYETVENCVAAGTVLLEYGGFSVDLGLDTVFDGYTTKKEKMAICNKYEAKQKISKVEKLLAASMESESTLKKKLLEANLKTAELSVERAAQGRLMLSLALDKENNERANGDLSYENLWCKYSLQARQAVTFRKIETLEVGHRSSTKSYQDEIKNLQSLSVRAVEEPSVRAAEELSVRAAEELSVRAAEEPSVRAAEELSVMRAIEDGLWSKNTEIRAKAKTNSAVPENKPTKTVRGFSAVTDLAKALTKKNSDMLSKSKSLQATLMQTANHLQIVSALAANLYKEKEKIKEKFDSIKQENQALKENWESALEKVKEKAEEPYRNTKLWEDYDNKVIAATLDGIYTVGWDTYLELMEYTPKAMDLPDFKLHSGKLYLTI